MACCITDIQLACEEREEREVSADREVLNAAGGSALVPGNKGASKTGRFNSTAGVTQPVETPPG